MMIRTTIRIFSIGLLCFGMASLWAGTQGDLIHAGADKPQYIPVATLTIGPDFVQKGEGQALTLLPPFQNYYTNTNSQSTVADAGVFLGIERMISEQISIQLGVSGYVDAQLSLNGDVWQFAEPLFDNLSYAYTLHNRRVLFTNKILTTLPMYHTIHPYVSWEIGAAFNQAGSYEEQPLIPLAIPMTPFSNHTQSSLTWGLGLGVDYNLNQHVRAGIGYQFANLGSAALGTTPDESTTQTLTVPHLYTNQLRFQFTFLL